VIFLAARSGSAAPSIPRQIEALLVKHRLARKRNMSKKRALPFESKARHCIAGGRAIPKSDSSSLEQCSALFWNRY
jgi:hypothetical protein